MCTYIVIRVPNWVLSKPAAIDLLVASPLNPTILLEARVTTGVVSWMTEQRKHCSSDGNVMNLDGFVYHRWLNCIEPGENRLWSLSPS